LSGNHGFVTAATKFAGSTLAGGFVGAGGGDAMGAGVALAVGVVAVGVVAVGVVAGGGVGVGGWEVVVEQAPVRRIVVRPSAAAVRMMVPFFGDSGTASSAGGKRKVRVRSYLRLTIAGLR
jgi:hypothetical protein